MHTIRLRHPWTCELAGAQAVWSRNFNWPAGQVVGEVVWLVIEPLAADTKVQLNGAALDVGKASGQFDVTKLIIESNRLTIELADTTGADESQCPLDVRLEIDDK